MFYHFLLKVSKIFDVVGNAKKYSGNSKNLNVNIFNPLINFCRTVTVTSIASSVYVDSDFLEVRITVVIS